jgi:hypothetical protein
MTDWIMQSDVGDPQILSRRLGSFLKRAGPSKDIARRIECDLRTIENLRAGRAWPIARHWLRIWLEFGDDVIEAVFYPERVEARLAREAAERERAKRARLAASHLMEPRAFSLAVVLGEPEEPGSELEPGPPNLDLFEAQA